MSDITIQSACGENNSHHSDVRQSNLELLRIVAMIMVMVLHADFTAFGVAPTHPADSEGWWYSAARVVPEMMSAVSVNAFILISGWFGIRTSFRGMMKFLFQCFFFFTLTYVIWLVANGFHVFSWKDAGTCLALGVSNWFVKAYAGLMIVAPLLNKFCESAQKQKLLWVIGTFYVYQTVWGWIGPNTSINNGYSAFSFIGLYLLARYLHLYVKDVNRVTWLVLYACCVLANCVLYYIPWCGMSALSYANPFNVVGATGLFMWFATMNLRPNRTINFIAASAFAVYVLHTSPKVMPYYLHGMQHVYTMMPPVLVPAAIICIMGGWYSAAILLDRIRICLWNICCDYMQGRAVNINA